MSENAISESWTRQVELGENKYDDFHEKVGSLRTDLQWTRAIMMSPNGADVAYHLGSHLNEAKAIIAMHPDAQAVAIGSLSAKLAAQPKQAAPVSKVPDPITPGRGSSIVRDAMPSDDDDINVWMKKENMRLAKRLQG